MGLPTYTKDDWKASESGWKAWAKSNTPTQKELDKAEKDRNDQQAAKDAAKQQKIEDDKKKNGRSLWDKTRDTAQLSTARVSTGLVQAGAGIYDIATPGKETNRVSKGMGKVAKALDQEAKDRQVEGIYKKANVAGELATYLVPGTLEAKLVNSSTKAAKVAAFAEKNVGKVADAFEKGGKVSSTLGKGVRKGLTAKNMAVDAAITAKTTGEDASRGEEITPQRVAGDAAMNLGGAVGGELLGKVLGKGVKALRGGKGKEAAKGVFDKTATPDGLVEDASGLNNLADGLNTGDRIDELAKEAQAAQEAKLGFKESQPSFDESKMLPATSSYESARPVAEVESDIQKLQTEGDPNLSAAESKQKFLDLQAEHAIALKNDAEKGFTMRQADKASFENNGLPNDTPGAQAALDNFDKSPPETTLKPDEQVDHAADIFAHPNMPPELKQAATQLLDDRGKVNSVLEDLMTPERKATAHDNMDKAYHDQMAEVEKMPEPRQEVEFQKLEEQYKSDLADLETRAQTDEPKVQEYQAILDHLNDKEVALTQHSNMLIKDNPDHFRTVDDAELKAQREPLEKNLEQSERFNSSEKIVSEVSNSPDPVHLVKSSPDALDATKTVMEKQTRQLSNFKSIDNRVVQSLLKVMSPSQILDKMGQSRIFAGLVRAESKINLANEADGKTIKTIVERLHGNKQLQEQIIDYLQGSRKTLSAADEETATLIRTFLDEKRIGLEKLGVGTLDDYFPQMVDKDNPDFVRLFESKVDGKISFGNFKKRLGNDGEYNKDIGEVLSLYASGYNKKVHLEPALKPLQDIQFQDKISAEEVKWVKAYTEQLMGAKRGGFETAIDTAIGKGRYRQALGAQRMISAVATMGLNPGTAVRNTVQMVNTIADIGPKHSYIGTMDGLRALRAGKGSAEWKELIEAGIMDGGVSHNYYDDINTDINLKGKISGTSNNVAKKMMLAIRATDVTLRAQAYYGAKSLGHEKGLVGQELQDFAINKVANSQFITSKIDMPIAFNGPGMRSLTQLATFTGKQAGFLSRMGVKMGKGADGKGFQITDTGNVFAGVAAAGLATEVLKPVMGFNEKEWIPFYEQISPYWPGGDDDGSGGDGVYRSPLVTLLAGNGKGKVGLIEAIQGAANPGDNNGHGDKLKKFAEGQWSSVVPAGTQIKKTYEGIKTTQSGISKSAGNEDTPNGKVRYLQDMTSGDKTKAAIFGQYSTKSGQDWIKSGFPTLTKSEMNLGEKDGSGEKTFEQLSRPEQKQYYDFYAASKKATGYDTAVKAIKAAAKDANINKAVKLADEFNKKSNNAMKAYWSKHPNQALPDTLSKKLTSDLRIDAQEQIDKATE